MLMQVTKVCRVDDRWKHKVKTRESFFPSLQFPSFSPLNVGLSPFTLIPPVSLSSNMSPIILSSPFESETSPLEYYRFFVLLFSPPRVTMPFPSNGYLRCWRALC